MFVKSKSDNSLTRAVFDKIRGGNTLIITNQVMRELYTMDTGEGYGRAEITAALQRLHPKTAFVVNPSLDDPSRYSHSDPIDLHIMYSADLAHAEVILTEDKKWFWNNVAGIDATIMNRPDYLYRDEIKVGTKIFNHPEVVKTNHVTKRGVRMLFLNRGSTVTTLAVRWKIYPRPGVVAIPTLDRFLSVLLPGVFCNGILGDSRNDCHTRHRMPLTRFFSITSRVRRHDGVFLYPSNPFNFCRNRVFRKAPVRDATGPGWDRLAGREWKERGVAPLFHAASASLVMSLLAFSGGQRRSMYLVRMANQTASTIRDTTHGRTASGMVAANSPIVSEADMPEFFQ